MVVSSCSITGSDTRSLRQINKKVKNFDSSLLASQTAVYMQQQAAQQQVQQQQQQVQQQQQQVQQQQVQQQQQQQQQVVQQQQQLTTIAISSIASLAPATLAINMQQTKGLQLANQHPNGMQELNDEYEE